MNHPQPLPWFRLYHEMVDEEKLRLLAFEDRWHYIALLCCKCKGILDSDCDEDMLHRRLAVRLGLQLRELDELKRRLMEVDLIEQNWNPKGWSKRQFNSDYSTNRVRKFRQKQAENGDETVSGNVSETQWNGYRPDTDTDTELSSNGIPFDEFWKVYPRKENKKKARTSWNRLSKRKQEKAISDCQVRYKHTEKKFIPLPTTYINGERWDDEGGQKERKRGLVV